MKDFARGSGLSERLFPQMERPIPAAEAETLPDGRPVLLILCASLYGGGAERVACRLANGLSRRWEVWFLYLRDKGESYPLDPAVHTVATPFFPCENREELAEKRAGFIREVKRTLDPAATISFLFTMNRINVETPGRGLVICSERNSPVKRDPGRLAEIERFYEKADHVVFQSETVRGVFSERVRTHSTVLPNPVGVTCLRRGGSRRIVNVGRLTPQKNQAMLLRAFAAFHRDHGEYTLSLCGEGELEGELRALADALGLGDAVRFHGQVRDVHREISDGEMFVLSSDYEGLSNALLECMMMGFACISTRCEGSVDVIRDGENGLLIDVGDEAQLTAAMTRLAEDAALREALGTGARRTAEAFREERVIARWERLLEELTGRTGSGQTIVPVGND